MDAQIVKQLTESMEKLGNKFDTFSSDFSNRLTKIETMFTMFDKAQNNLSNKMDDVEKISNEALQSTKAAHKRLDSIEIDVERIEDNVEEIAKVDAVENRIDKLEKLVTKVLFWFCTTVIGAVILGVMAILFQGGEA